jgi:hypothetical protein
MDDGGGTAGSRGDETNRRGEREKEKEQRGPSASQRNKRRPRGWKLGEGENKKKPVAMILRYNIFFSRRNE